MDERLQRIADQAKQKYGLDAYTLERCTIYKERDYTGKPFYSFTMEWFPNEISEPLEDDMNPEGTAIITFHIQNEAFTHVTFAQGTSFSTKTQFIKKTVEEAAAWIEEETDLSYGIDFTFSERSKNRFTFIYNNGIRLTPACSIEIEFDEKGKLTSYRMMNRPQVVQKSDFSLSLGEIEPLVKEQLKLVNFPRSNLTSVYGIDEVFVSTKDLRLIPFMEHERTQILVNEVIEYDSPLDRDLPRRQLSVILEATAEEAFSQISADDMLTVTDIDLMHCKKVVTDLLRTILPNGSGIWKLHAINREECFIEAFCRLNVVDSNVFKRKIVVFIDPHTHNLLNYIDNGELVEQFVLAAPAEKIEITHEEAFKKLLPYITLKPVYVFDQVTNQFILCGLLDSNECVDAGTGEIKTLADI